MITNVQQYTSVNGEVNPIYEYNLFQSQLQKQDESMNKFILGLHDLIKTCM